ncbi:hypothetical protein MPSEU_000990700 [Mayamaea pseudoterrestris]|nr:hypothetical protein MPSEU_000990700 [Mayamaea pseudoterrestris]
MCQLLGMNCAAPTDFSFSLRGFCKRGGDTDVHSHGFGVCVYQGRGLQCFHDTQAACKSPIAQLVQYYPMRTLNMMAHIRYATQGAVSLENVHPFTRVWKGIQLCFAHNGDCPKFKQVEGIGQAILLLGKSTPENILYHPVGDTDSEAVFCAILNALNAEFPGNQLPTLPVLHEFLSTLCDEITKGDGPDETIFNFLLGCGQYTQFAFSWPGKRHGSSVWNGLHYLIREPPFTIAKLVDDDYSINFAEMTTINDRVAVIATKPLTGETGWIEMARGELIMFDKGKAYRTPKCCEIVEQEGRGLTCKWFAEKCHSWKKTVRLPTPSLPKPIPIKQQRVSSSQNLASSVHAETILTSPALTNIPRVVSCSLADAIPEPPGVSESSANAPSPTTVALEPRHDEELEHHFVRLNVSR